MSGPFYYASNSNGNSAYSRNDSVSTTNTSNPSSRGNAQHQPYTNATASSGFLDAADTSYSSVQPLSRQLASPAPSVSSTSGSTVGHPQLHGSHQSRQASIHQSPYIPLGPLPGQTTSNTAEQSPQSASALMSTYPGSGMLSSAAMPFGPYSSSAQADPANARYGEQTATNRQSGSGLSTMSPHLGGMGMYGLYGSGLSAINGAGMMSGPELLPPPAAPGLPPVPNGPSSIAHGGMVGLDGNVQTAYVQSGVLGAGGSVLPLAGGLPGVGLNGAPLIHQAPNMVLHPQQSQYPNHHMQFHQHQQQGHQSQEALSSTVNSNQGNNKASNSASGHGGNNKARMPGQHQSSQDASAQVVAAAAASGVEMADPLALQHPTYIGHIKTAVDAILLLSACDHTTAIGKAQQGTDVELADDGLPRPRRVTRRLLDGERASLIHSGSIFAWDEKEAGMRRWTDGRCWSASRVSGCFLTYRELEGKKKTAAQAALIAAQTGKPSTGSTANTYKIDGLIKQSFSITTLSGRKLHIISYYTKRDIRENRLRKIHEDPHFRRALSTSSSIFTNGSGLSLPLLPSLPPANKKARSSGKGKADGPNGSLDGSDLEGGVLQWADRIDDNEYQDPTSRTAEEGEGVDGIIGAGGSDNRSGDEGNGAGGSASGGPHGGHPPHRDDSSSQKRKRADGGGGGGGSGGRSSNNHGMHNGNAASAYSHSAQGYGYYGGHHIEPPIPFDAYQQRHGPNGHAALGYRAPARNGSGPSSSSTAEAGRQWYATKSESPSAGLSSVHRHVGEHGHGISAGSARATLPSLTSMSSAIRSETRSRNGTHGSSAGPAPTLSSLPPGAHPGHRLGHSQYRGTERPPLKRRYAETPAQSTDGDSTRIQHGRPDASLPLLHRPMLGRRKRSSSYGEADLRSSLLMSSGRLPTLKTLRGRTSPPPVLAHRSADSSEDDSVRLPPLTAWHGTSGGQAPHRMSIPASMQARSSHHQPVSDSHSREYQPHRRSDEGTEHVEHRGHRSDRIEKDVAYSGQYLHRVLDEPITRSQSRAEQESAVGALLSLRSGPAGSGSESQSGGKGKHRSHSGEVSLSNEDDDRSPVSESSQRSDLADAEDHDAAVATLASSRSSLMPLMTPLTAISEPGLLRAAMMDKRASGHDLPTPRTHDGADDEARHGEGAGQADEASTSPIRSLSMQSNSNSDSSSSSSTGRTNESHGDSVPRSSTSVSTADSTPMPATPADHAPLRRHGVSSVNDMRSSVGSSATSRVPAALDVDPQSRGSPLRSTKGKDAAVAGSASLESTRTVASKPGSALVPVVERVY